jgi:hypothetical protein
MDEVIQKLGEAKQLILKLATEHQADPAVPHITRQTCDSLDSAYLFYSSLVAHINATEQAIEEKVATGDTIQFPAKA